MANEPSRRRRWLKLAGVTCAVGALVLVIATVWTNLRGRAAERAVLAELEARGWSLAQTPQLDSDARRSYAATVTVLHDSADEADGLPHLGFGDVHFGVPIDPAMSARVASYVAAHAAFHEQLAAALADPEFTLARSHNPLDDDLVAGFSDARRVARALALWSVHAQLTGDADAAIDRVVDVMRLRQAFYAEPILLTHLVALSIDAIAMEAAQDTLSRCEPSPDAIGRLLDELRRAHPAATYHEAMRGEVVYQARGLDRLDDYVDQTTQDVIDWAATWSTDEVGLMIDPRVDPMIGVLPTWARRHTPFNVRLDARLTRWCYAIWPGLWRAGQAERVRQYLLLHDRVAALDMQRLDFWSQVQIIATDFADDEFRGIEASSRSGEVFEAKKQVVIAGLLVERHRLEHGSWPATLVEAGAAADDPFSTESLIYHSFADGVVVYSVGPNGIDDGGVQDGVFVSRGDIAFRLLAPAARGTLAPPPETPEAPEESDDAPPL